MAKETKDSKQPSNTPPVRSVGEETTERYTPSPEPMTHPETSRVDY